MLIYKWTALLMRCHTLRDSYAEVYYYELHDLSHQFEINSPGRLWEFHCFRKPLERLLHSLFCWCGNDQATYLQELPGI